MLLPNRYGRRDRTAVRKLDGGTMLLATARIARSPSDARRALDVDAAIVGVLSSGRVAGIFGESLLTRTTDAWTLTAHTPSRRALAELHADETLREEVGRLTAATGSALTWTVEGDEPRPRENPPSIVLRPHQPGRGPCWRGDDGAHLPAFELGLDLRTRSDLTTWSDAWCAHDDVWLFSEALETRAYRELAVVDSQLNRMGREVARDIESATGIPTYLFLKRYHGYARIESDLVCPCCGGSWVVGEEASPVDLHRHETRCDACRLVSEIGGSTDSPYLASIGARRRR